MTAPRFITVQKDSEDNFKMLAVDKIESVAMRPPAEGTNKRWTVVIRLAGHTRNDIETYIGEDASGDAGYADAQEAFGALEKLLGSFDFSGAFSDGGDLRKSVGGYLIKRSRND